MTVELIPMSVSDALAFCAQHHRHRKAPLSGLFAVGVADGETVRGAAIVGRPVARVMDDGFTAEVTRVTTDGAHNACSMLDGACWRAARAMGCRKLITYTLASESGASLRAAGWRVVGEIRGKTWTCPSRPRVDHYPLQRKLRWEA